MNKRKSTEHMKYYLFHFDSTKLWHFWALCSKYGFNIVLGSKRFYVKNFWKKIMAKVFWCAKVLDKNIWKKKILTKKMLWFEIFGQQFRLNNLGLSILFQNFLMKMFWGKKLFIYIYLHIFPSGLTAELIQLR